MKRSILLLPPLRNINFGNAEMLAATPIWLISATGMQSSSLGDWLDCTVELWLDAADVLLLHRKLPKLPEKRLRQALANNIEDLLAGDMATVHCSVGPENTDDQRWIATIPRIEVENLLKALHAQRVSVERIGSPSLSLLNQPDGVFVWANPAAIDELRWAMHIGSDVLGGDSALAEALGAIRPDTLEALLPDRPDWNLIDNFDLDLPRRKSQRFHKVKSRLKPFQRLAIWSLLPLSVFFIGLGIDTIRLDLEKRRLVAIPTKLFESLNPGQAVMMDARLLLSNQLDRLNGQANPEGNGRQLLPLLDAAGRLRNELPGQPVPAGSEFSNGQLTLKFAVPPLSQPAKQGNFAVQWRSNGREAIISAQEGS